MFELVIGDMVQVKDELNPMFGKVGRVVSIGIERGYEFAQVFFHEMNNPNEEVITLKYYAFELTLLRMS